jgi:hypothetical protein
MAIAFVASLAPLPALFAIHARFPDANVPGFHKAWACYLCGAAFAMVTVAATVWTRTH